MDVTRAYLASLIVVPYWVIGGLLMDARRALLRRWMPSPETPIPEERP